MVEEVIESHHLVFGRRTVEPLCKRKQAVCVCKPHRAFGYAYAYYLSLVYVHYRGNGQTAFTYIHRESEGVDIDVNHSHKVCLYVAAKRKLVVKFAVFVGCKLNQIV